MARRVQLYAPRLQPHVCVAERHLFITFPRAAYVHHSSREHLRLPLCIAAAESSLCVAPQESVTRNAKKKASNEGLVPNELGEWPGQAAAREREGIRTSHQLAALQHGQSASLGSAPARPLRLLMARLVALGSSAPPGWASASLIPATASAARARRLQSRPFHCL